MRQGSKALQAEKRQLLGFLSCHRDRVKILGQMIWIKLPIVSTDWLVITMWVHRLFCLSRHFYLRRLAHLHTHFSPSALLLTPDRTSADTCILALPRTSADTLLP
jgi:hypothetical protein